MKKARKKLKLVDKAKTRDVMTKTQEKLHKETQKVPPEVREKVASASQEVGDLADRTQDIVNTIVKEQTESETGSQAEE